MPMSNELALTTDTALAELHREAANIRQRISSNEVNALHAAGAEFYYRNRRRVTDMTTAEAEAILAEVIAANEGESDYARYDLLPGRKLGNHSLGQMRTTVAKLAELRAELRRTADAMKPLDATYAEHHWSRFFLVTSSAGHIHSSMSCSTCRPTTTYGWLPELSGHTEAEAVEAHGPALCSVCFASAPVEWVGGKITKAQAEKRAA